MAGTFGHTASYTNLWEERKCILVRALLLSVFMYVFENCAGARVEEKVSWANWCSETIDKLVLSDNRQIGVVGQ